jgi:hypothetical protein
MEKDGIMNEKIGVKDIRKHIRKCIRYRRPYNFLGLVENRELTEEAEALFSSPRGNMYDWINGNDRMLKIIIEEEQKKNMSAYEQLCRRCGFVPDKE